MQLVNETRIPNDVLRPLLAEAAKRAKAKTTGVLVRVKWGWKRSNASGRTVRWRIVAGKRRRLNGHVELVLSRRTEPLEFARWFWRVAVHEWSHVEQDHRFVPYEADLPYRERTQEMVAYDLDEQASRNIPARVQDMILNLALAREALTVPRNPSPTPRLLGRCSHCNAGIRKGEAHVHFERSGERLCMKCHSEYAKEAVHA